MASTTFVRTHTVCERCANALRQVGAAKRSVRHLSHSRNASTANQPGAKPINEQPFRLGIVGSGPAGFYAATRIIEKMPGAMVDMYEQLPVPFGLVRFGVAPDHPEVKNCEERFEQVAESPRFNFIGNVAIGSQVPLGVLKPHYDALLFAYGASEDKLLGIPGEHLKGVYSARAFVGWYNGLPEHADLDPMLDNGEVATVIGHGNVALDVTRILLANVDELRSTDITDQAIDALSQSKIRKVITVGRRGPIQAAFTIKEVRELTKLKNTNFLLKDPSLLPTKEYISSLPKLEQRRYRLTNLLLESWKQAKSSSIYQNAWELWSLRSPLAFETSSENSSGFVQQIKFGVNEFVNENDRFKPTARIKSTSATEYLDTSLALRSVGFKSVDLPTLESDLGIVFNDDAGVIPNDPYGRVVLPRPEHRDLLTNRVPGCYCAGWVKNGPTGVIANTMDDAFSTADVIIKDWETDKPFLNGSASDRGGTGRGYEAVHEDSALHQSTSKPVHWTDWSKINAAELELGKKKGKRREKFRSAKAMLDVLS